MPLIERKNVVIYTNEMYEDPLTYVKSHYHPSILSESKCIDAQGRDAHVGSKVYKPDMSVHSCSQESPQGLLAASVIQDNNPTRVSSHVNCETFSGSYAIR